MRLGGATPMVAGKMAARDGGAKVCLIGPPTVTDFEDQGVAESDAIRLIAEHAPIGILSLASVLEQHGIIPQIVDLNRLYYTYLRSAETPEVRGDFCTFVVRSLEARDVDVFGFSTICSSYPLTLRIAGEIKKTRPGATIVLGGPQASVVDVSTMKAFPFIDYIVRGEAEDSFPELVRVIEGKTPPEKVAGITYRRDTEVLRTPNAALLDDLDRIPMPAFHLYPELKECRYVPLELGRGCPFGCTFCSTNDFFRRRFRLKSPQRVIEQMKQIRDIYGLSTFDLIHDMFTVDRKRVVAFCEALLASGENFYWNCSARTDCIDDELIDLMARAGCRGIFFGIETGSARLQKVIQKDLDLHEAISRIECNDKHGIITAVSLISGFPTETAEDMQASVDFIMDSLRFDHAEPQFHILAPLAETPIHSQYREQLLFDDIFSDMSYQGWRQDPADREMIQGHPDIFPNFYAVPTPDLDRPYLKELREFLMNGIERFRWLLVGLHQDSGTLVKVFDEFRAWRRDLVGKDSGPDTDDRYYTGLAFRDDFIEFVRECYSKQLGRAKRAIGTMAGYEAALDAAELEKVSDDLSTGAAPPQALDSSAIPRVAEGVRLAELTSDYQRVIRCLRRKGDLRRIPPRPAVMATRQHPDKRVDVIHLSPLSAQLMQLCDGVLTVGEISDRFVLKGKQLADIPPRKACLFGLELLRQQGLIVPSNVPAQEAVPA